MKFTILLSKINKIISSKINIQLILLNAISSISYLFFTNSFTIQEILFVICFSATISFLEYFFINLFTNETIKRLIAYLIFSIYNIIIIIDYYLLYKFHLIINNTIIDIISVTNVREVIDFITTYINWGMVFMTLILILILNYLIIKISNFINYKSLIPLIIIGFILYFYAFFSLFILKKDVGLSIPQHNSITRILYSCYYVKTDLHIGELRHICKNTKARYYGTEEELSIIVVIGESHNLYHSSLYGYEKETNPLLKNRVKNDELFVFTNVITTEDLTSKVMESVFSLDSMGYKFNITPLYPACFKAAGFYSVLYDNEYFIDKSTYFLCNNILSQTLFDLRNNKEYQFDDMMIKDIIPIDTINSLYTIHLVGQHYAYEKRSPDSFKKFTTSDYPNKLESQRQTIADYDNACLYNDFVINEIIKKFENKNACLIYFSDHGEEMFDIRNYCGHGTARSSPDIRYQIRIPCMIWYSNKYKMNYPEKTKLISQSLHRPISTDDISHTILDLGNIMNDYFNPQRSFINSNYNTNRERIILNNLNYDKVITNYKQQ